MGSIGSHESHVKIAMVEAFEKTYQEYIKRNDLPDHAVVRAGFWLTLGEITDNDPCPDEEIQKYAEGYVEERIIQELPVLEKDILAIHNERFQQD